MSYREKRRDGTVTVTGGVGLLDAWPIGAVYISIVNTNPGALFGGTWVAFATGRMLIDPDDPAMADVYMFKRTA